MVCEISCGDGPMTAAQLNAYLRHRYPDIKAYYNRQKDAVILPVSEDTEAIIPDVRELAARKGLYTTMVSAAWPEYLDGDILALEGDRDFLVVYEIKGKFIR